MSRGYKDRVLEAANIAMLPVSTYVRAVMTKKRAPSLGVRAYTGITEGSYRLTLFFNDDEFEHIEQGAAMLGMSRSQYSREGLRGNI